LGIDQHWAMIRECHRFLHYLFQKEREAADLIHEASLVVGAAACEEVDPVVVLLVLRVPSYSDTCPRVACRSIEPPSLGVLQEASCVTWDRGLGYMDFEEMDWDHLVQQGHEDRLGLLVAPGLD